MANNPPRWDEITQSPNFTALPFDEREKLRGAYFNDFVAPTVEPAKIDLARKEWNELTGPPPSATAGGRMTDSAIDLAKGAIGLGESGVGILDLISFGAAGKAMESIGYDPKRTKAFLSDYYTNDRKQANQNVQDAKGFIDTSMALLENPSALLGIVTEAIPGTLGIAGVGRMVATRAYDAAYQIALRTGGAEAAREAGIAAVKEAIPRVLTAVSATEGAQAAGSIAQQARQEGKEWADYVMPAFAAGVGTAAIGRVGGAVANKFGLGDLETGIATAGLGGKGAGTATGGFLARTGKGAVREGLMEEMPQSYQEQLFTNVATGRPLTEGAGEAAATGLLAGAAMGGVHAGIMGRENPPETPPPDQGRVNPFLAPGGPSGAPPSDPTGRIEPHLAAEQEIAGTITSIMSGTVDDAITALDKLTTTSADRSRATITVNEADAALLRARKFMDEHSETLDKLTTTTANSGTNDAEAALLRSRQAETQPPEEPAPSEAQFIEGPGGRGPQTQSDALIAGRPLSALSDRELDMAFKLTRSPEKRTLLGEAIAGRAALLRSRNAAPPAVSEVNAPQTEYEKTQGDPLRASLVRDGSAPETRFAATGTSIPVEQQGVRVEPIQVGQLKASPHRVTNAADAAHVMAAMRRDPQERFSILALNKDDEPIAVLPIHRGGTSAAAVWPETVAKAVYQTPGVAKIWYAHNHPSGEAKPSVADEALTNKLSQMFGPGTGVEVAGHVIIGQQQYAELDKGGYPLATKQAIPARARTQSIPVTERRIQSNTPINQSLILSPQTARTVIPESLGGETGVVFVDAQGRAVGALRMSPDEMMHLRNGKGARNFFQKAGQSNATRFFAYVDDAKHSRADASVAFSNLKKLSETTSGFGAGNNFEMEDGLYGDESFRELGELSSHAGPTFFARGSRTTQGLGRERTQSVVDRVSSAWKNGPVVHVVNGPDEYPEGVRARDKSQRGRAQAFTHNGEVYIDASAVGNEQRVGELMLHEGVVHHGLRKTFTDPDISKIIQQVKVGRRSDVDAIIKNRGGDVTADEAAEELIAHLAETNPQHSIVKKTIASIRNFLRSVGLVKELSDNDIIQNFIMPARRVVETGKGKLLPGAKRAFGIEGGKALSASSVIAAAREAPLWRSGLEEFITKSGPNVATASNWLGTIESWAKQGKFSPSELEHSGLKEWLGIAYQKTDRVSKDAIREYLDKNGVILGEIMLAQNFVRSGDDSGGSDADFRFGDHETEEPDSDYISDRAAELLNEDPFHIIEEQDVADLAREKALEKIADQRGIDQSAIDEDSDLEFRALVQDERNPDSPDSRGELLDEFDRLKAQGDLFDNDELRDATRKHFADMIGASWEAALEELKDDSRTREKAEEAEYRAYYDSGDAPTTQLIRVVLPNGERRDFSYRNGYGENEIYDSDNGSEIRIPRHMRNSFLDNAELESVITDYLREEGELRDPDAESEWEDHQDGRAGLPTDNAMGKTRWNTYKLDDGEDYRELLITLPMPRLNPDEEAEMTNLSNIVWGDLSPEQKDRLIFLAGKRDAHYYSTTHWGDTARGVSDDAKANIAHMRFQTFADADGKKVLFLDEIQSDWAQSMRQERDRLENGRSTGGEKEHFHAFKPKEVAAVHNSHFGAVIDSGGTEDSFTMLEAARDEMKARALKRFPKLADFWVEAQTSPPEGPFVTNTDAWVSLGLKRMIMYAVDNGYDRIAWTTGEQQLERWQGLIQARVDSLSLVKSKDGKFELLGYKDNSRVLSEKVTPQQLPDYIGRDAANKLLNGGEGVTNTAFTSDNIEWAHSINSDEILVGSGMRAFYEDVLPKVTEKVLKKVGGDKVTTFNFKTEPPVDYVMEPHVVTPEEASVYLSHVSGTQDYAEAGERIFKVYPRNKDPDVDNIYAYYFRTEGHAEAWIKVQRESQNQKMRSRVTTQPGFEITEKMKAEANRGLTMFARRPPEMEIVAETTPSTSLTAGKAAVSMPPAKLRELHDKIASEVTPEQIAEAIGFTKPFVVGQGEGGYAGQRAPNMIIHGDLTDTEADELTRALAYVYRQDAVPWFRATETGDTAGVSFNFKAELTDENRQAFFDSLRASLGPDAGYTQIAPNELVVLNFDPSVSSDAFFDKLAGLLNGNNLPELNSAEEFFAKTGYESHDWSADPHGARALETRFPGQPDLQERLRDLYGRAAAITRRNLRGEPLDGHPLFDTAGNLIANTYEGFGAVWDKLNGTKAVDGLGQPLVFFHGLTSEEEVRKIPASPQSGGVWVTPDATYAARHSETRGFKGSATGIPVGNDDRHVLPLYASIKNPIDLRDPAVLKEQRALWEKGVKLWEGDHDAIILSNKQWLVKSDDQLVSAIEPETGFTRFARSVDDPVVGDYYRVRTPNGIRYGKVTSISDSGLVRLQRIDKEGAPWEKRNKDGVTRETIIASKADLIERQQLNRHYGELEPEKDDDTRFARIPDWVKQEPPETQEALRKAGVFYVPPTLASRVQAWKAQWQKHFKQGLFDQFDPIKEYDYKAYMHARLSKGHDSALEAMLFYGTVKLDQDGAVEVNYERDGFMGILRSLKGEHDRFFAWVVGNRAERLMGENREHNFTPEDIVRLKALNQGQLPDGTARGQLYANALLNLVRYNKSALDMAEKAGLIDPASRAVWEHDFYVPFYRMTEGDDSAIPNMPSGLVKQYAFKTLKGGSDVLGDPLENVLRNWAHLITASLRNQAAVESLEAAERLGGAHQIPSAVKGSVFVMQGGQQVHYEVDDPFLLDAIKSIGFSGFGGKGMEIMQNVKRWLTVGVTVSPTFRIRNVARDSIQMIGTNPASYNILSNIVLGWKGTEEGSAEFGRILAGGGVIRYGTYLEGDRGEYVKRLIDKGVNVQTILSNPRRVRNMISVAIDWWQHVGDRSENINRVALYDQIIDQGGTHLEASYRARDTMDFSMQGTWPAIRFLAQTVPFMNARLQGMYKIGRGAAEDPRRFGVVLGAVALASMALFLAYKDDDDWKQREDWDRENYWWFKIGQTAYRIPKPFEVGALGTIAERGLEAMLNSKDFSVKDFAKSMGNILMNQLSMNPTPQLVKPLMELWANKDMFTGRQIETDTMEDRLTTAERYNANTSAVARLAGKAGIASPVQIDHLIKGYFGWLGTHIVATADFALRPAMGMPGQPARRLDDYFVVGDFAKELPSYESKYVTRLYDQAEKVQQAMGDMRSLAKAGAIDEARKKLEDNRDTIRLSGLYENSKRHLAQLNTQIKLTQKRAGLTPEERRAQLDTLYAARNKIAKAVDESARAAE